MSLVSGQAPGGPIVVSAVIRVPAHSREDVRMVVSQKTCHCFR